MHYQESFQFNFTLLRLDLFDVSFYVKHQKMSYKDIMIEKLRNHTLLSASMQFLYIVKFTILIFLFWQNLSFLNHFINWLFNYHILIVIIHIASHTSYNSFYLLLIVIFFFIIIIFFLI